MNRNDLRDQCQNYIASKATCVPEHLSKRILESYNVKVPQGKFVKTALEALTGAQEIGYPVAVKAVSTELVHKTELNAVRLNLGDDKALTMACEEINEAFSQRNENFDGFLLEKMALGGAEFIVGLQNDP